MVVIKQILQQIPCVLTITFAACMNECDVHILCHAYVSKVQLPILQGLFVVTFNTPFFMHVFVYIPYSNLVLCIYVHMCMSIYVFLVANGLLWKDACLL